VLFCELGIAPSTWYAGDSQTKPFSTPKVFIEYNIQLKTGRVTDNEDHAGARSRATVTIHGTYTSGHTWPQNFDNIPKQRREQDQWSYNSNKHNHLNS